MNRKKIGALILCFGFILVLAAASAFVIHEAGHECSGEECPVCRMIAASLSLLRFAGLAVLILPAGTALSRLFYSRAETARRHIPFAGTLVSWKIRIND